MKGVAKGVMGTTAVVEDLEPKIYEWEYQGQGFGTGVIQNIVSLTSNGSRILAGMSIGNIAYSDDSGYSWTQLEQGLGNEIVHMIQGVACSPSGRFVISIKNNLVFYSDDGLIWTPSNDISDISGNYAHIACSPSGRFVVGGSSGYAARSDDGVSWIQLERNLNNGSLNGSMSSVYCNPYTGRFFAFSGNYGSYSDDGITWHQLPYQLGLTLPNVNLDCLGFYEHGTVVAGFASGYGGYSTNGGVSWELIERGFATGSTGAATFLHGDNTGQMIFINDYGYTSYSTNGIDWTSVGVVFNHTLYDIIQAPNGDMIVGGVSAHWYRGT